MKNYKELILEQLKAERIYIERYVLERKASSLDIIAKMINEVKLKNNLTRSDYDAYDKELLSIDAKISVRKRSLKK